MTTQPVFSFASTTPTGTVDALWPVLNTQFQGTSGGVVWPTAGTFANFLVVIDAAPGTSNSRTFTFTNITTAATVTVTINDAEVSDRNIINTLSVSAGDQLKVSHASTGSPSAITECYLLAEFTGTVDGESGYTCAHAAGNGALTGTGGPYYVHGPFTGVTWTTTTPPVNEDLIAVEGNVTSMTCHATTAPGVGNSWTFWLVKNGVLQDGAGGTVNTLVTVTNTTPPTATSTFTLPVSPGDRLSLKLDGVSDPANTRPQAGITITADTDGECQLNCRQTTGSSSSAVNYGWAIYNSTTGWSATETARDQPTFISTFGLGAMYVRLQTAPGAGNSYLYDMRLDAGSPSGALSVLISDAATTGNDVSGSLVLEDGHLWDIRSTPTSSPAGAGAAFAWAIAAPTVVTGMPFAPFIGTIINSGGGSFGPFTG